MYHETECGCGHSGHRHHSQHTPMDAGHHHLECSSTPDYPHRRFLTKEEVIAQLEEYLKQLQLEAKGVEEHIAELKKGEA